MTQTVVCMKWGTRYGPEFANRLYSAARRNTAGDLRFICFTDDREGLEPGVEAWPLPPITIPERVAWTPWRKLSLWQAPLADIAEGDVLALDLDLLITGPLDDFFAYRPGEYCVIENWTQKGKGVGNTSCFRIPVGKFSEIFERFNADPEAVLGRWRIEQQYISDTIPQVYWPAEWCLSFKHSIVPPFPLNWVRAPRLPSDARIVAFTGQPDQDAAAEGRWPAPIHKRFYKHVLPSPWINEHWR